MHRIEQRLPSIWKMADVSPLPIKKPVLDLKKDLRPISLTPCVSKVAEEFVAEDVVKPAFLSVIHGNQYGTIPKSNVNNAQGITNEVIEWSHKNRAVLNPDKCKELTISFSRNPEPFEAVTIDGNEIEVVNTAKLLELTISDDLTWNAHLHEVVMEASNGLDYLLQTWFSSICRV